MQQRKYFLDWLRIIAFALLIVFHLGLLYVSWPYNLKSPRLFPELEYAMNALNPWRLALLFFISGVACRYLLRKLPAAAFSWERTRRLLPVIVFGMLVVIPPQTYVELYSEGHVTGGYLEFWLTSYLASDPYPGKLLPTWDHLWFLVYILLYSLVLAAIVRFTALSSSRIWSGRIPVAMLVALPAAWLCAANWLVVDFQPVTHALVDDWAAHLRWIGMFGAGVAAAFCDDFWNWVRERRRALTFIALCLLGVQLACIAAYEHTDWISEAVDGPLYAVSRGLYGWAAILALCGHAAAFLDRASRPLSYLTEAVLPIYVLHQPVLLATAYFTFPLQLPVALEAGLLALITGVGCLLMFELLVRRFRAMRFLFGLKPRADLSPEDAGPERPEPA